MKDGGPAFPGPVQATIEQDIHEGLSLRDYFASVALQGMCAAITKFRDDGLIIVNCPTDLSELAYTYADAMLAERKKC